jgi:hypothetical protein
VAESLKDQLDQIARLEYPTIERQGPVLVEEAVRCWRSLARKEALLIENKQVFLEVINSFGSTYAVAACKDAVVRIERELEEK